MSLNQFGQPSSNFCAIRHFRQNRYSLFGTPFAMRFEYQRNPRQLLPGSSHFRQIRTPFSSKSPFSKGPLLSSNLSIGQTMVDSQISHFHQPDYRFCQICRFRQLCHFTRSFFCNLIQIIPQPLAIFCQIRYFFYTA